MQSKDKAFVQALCYGVCRQYHRLDFILNNLLDKPLKDMEVKSLLLVGLYQLNYMRVKPYAAVSESVLAARKKPWAKALVNAVLRNYLRDKDNLEAKANTVQSAALSHPDWLIRQLELDWPDQAADCLQANNQPPPMALRVNLKKISRESYLQRLAEKDIAASAVSYCRSAIILDNPVPVELLPGFNEGLVSVQDTAAQLAAELLDVRIGHRVLDVCAAPGGKAAHILENQPQLRELHAVDIDESRMRRVTENLQRLGLSATLIVGDAAKPEAWWDGRPFDRILLDAPCSASGVIRRHPDIKLLRRAEDIPSLQLLQKLILNAVWPLLAPDGILLYATCSIFKQENEQQIQAFLAEHPDAVELPIDAAWGVAGSHGRQIMTGESAMDGFYYARLKKGMNKAQVESRKSKDTGMSCFCLFFVGFLLWLPLGYCHAEKFGVEIKTAELSLQDNGYVLSADMAYRLSERAKEALRNGVPLFWNLTTKVKQHRDYFWDKTIAEKVIRYRIQYHALLNMYRVRNESTGNVENFSTLSAALELMSILRNFRILDKSSLDLKNSYFAEMKVIFDREALPLPLRPIAYLNSHWYLSSDWYIWPLTK